MANYPTSLDTLTNPTGASTLDNPSHSDQHSDLNDIVEALEAKVGVTGSAVKSSHDYKLAVHFTELQRTTDITSGGGADNTVAFGSGTEIVDEGGLHSTTANTERISFKRAGLYLWSAFSQWTSGTDGSPMQRQWHQVELIVGGASTRVWRHSHHAYDELENRFSSMGMAYVTQAFIDSGAYLRLRVREDNGGESVTVDIMHLAAALLAGTQPT